MIVYCEKQINSLEIEPSDSIGKSKKGYGKTRRETIKTEVQCDPITCYPKSNPIEIKESDRSPIVSNTKKHVYNPTRVLPNQSVRFLQSSRKGERDCSRGTELRNEMMAELPYEEDGKSERSISLEGMRTPRLDGRRRRRRRILKGRGGRALISCICDIERFGALRGRGHEGGAYVLLTVG
jgi:hypothetical protein